MKLNIDSLDFMSSSRLKIAIIGPTASGKSQLATEIAKYINGVVINGDPFQSYSNLSIGTGQPSQSQQKIVQHIGYGCLPLTVRWNAVSFGTHVREIIKNYRRLVLVTGSGMYLRSIWRQLTILPNVSNNVSEKVDYLRHKLGSHLLYRFLTVIDPLRANMIHYNDTSRLVRALKVYFTTSHRPSLTLSDKNNQKFILPEDWRVLLVLPSVVNMRTRIGNRVIEMLNNGWLDEIRELLTLGLDLELRRINPIGYDVLLDNLLLDDSIDVIMKITDATLSYAKRQSTFFRNHWPDIKRWDPDYDTLDLALKYLGIS